MICVFVIAVLFGWPCSWALKDEERKEILDSHNKFRSINFMLNNFIYSTNLEKLAKEWVDRCEFKHPERTDPKYSGLGQNLGMTTKIEVNLHGMVEMWYNETKYYTYAINYCEGVCGHYTQVVWAQSLQLGCAYKVCSPLVARENVYPSALFVACQYSPPGNFNGQKPYMSGIECTMCPSGYNACDNGLCVTKSPGKTSTKSPQVSTSCSNRTTTSSTTSVSCSKVLAMMALVIAKHIN
ncbi:unnamed protein product [Rodentolepis nana]|uniref:SCP domain-containing protein n=1 Tax=Rodentolepis nana TaxID=102285 RepID=A0A0R3TAE7_RODNA|nr:unnamed protein product [Rodentolepis nana]